MARLEAVPGTGKARRRSGQAQTRARLRAVDSDSAEVGGEAAPKPRGRAAKSKRRRPDAPAIINTLNREHRYLASLLDVLDEQLVLMRHEDEEVDFALLRDVMHYLVNYPDERHHPREDILFERLRARDRAIRPTLDELTEAHGEMCRHARELLDAFEGLAEADGSVPQADDDLQGSLRRYLVYYREHMDIEEGEVFPRAAARLRDEDWEVVNRESRDLEDPLFGERVRREYQRLARELAERMDRAAEEAVVAEMFGIEALVEGAVILLEGAGDLRRIVRERFAAALHDNFDDTRQTLTAPSPLGLVGLPFRIAGNNWRHTSGALRDGREVVQRRTRELGEPFLARWSAFRQVVRQDWD